MRTIRLCYLRCKTDHRLPNLEKKTVFFVEFVILRLRRGSYFLNSIFFSSRIFLNHFRIPLGQSFLQDFAKNSSHIYIPHINHLQAQLWSNCGIGCDADRLNRKWKIQDGGLQILPLAAILDLPVPVR